MSALETFYVLIGLASIGLVFWWNRDLYRGGGASGLELTYYASALVALLVGWFFNFQYFRGYGEAVGWWHWTTLVFVNPAAASAGQDLVIANLVLFPLWTMVDGRREGLRAAWWYFPMSLLTSFAFAIALFLAVRERQRRLGPATAAA